MKAKRELTFGLLYFGLLIFGYISGLFTFLADFLFGNNSIYIFYHDYLVIVIKNIVRLIIYLIGISILAFTYQKVKNITYDKKTLPLKNKIILYAITAVTITIVSILANWQLKILTDLGDKYNIYNVYVKLTEIAVLIAEIYLLVCMIYHFDKFTTSNFKSYKYFSFCIIPVLLTYSVYSLIVDFSIYQFVFIPFTILLGFIYPYTNKSLSITYLIALLVFLF